MLKFKWKEERRPGGFFSGGVPPAKLLGKLSRRALDKQLVLRHGYWNCFRFSHGSWISGLFFSGLDFRIRFASGFDQDLVFQDRLGFSNRIGFSGTDWIFRTGYGFSERIGRFQRIRKNEVD
jgi:hypothetical protein